MEFDIDVMDMLLMDEVNKLRRKFDTYGDNVDAHIDIGT